MLLNCIALCTYVTFRFVSYVFTIPNPLCPVQPNNLTKPYLTVLLSKSNYPHKPIQSNDLYITEKSQMERIFSGAWKEKHGDQTLDEYDSDSDSNEKKETSLEVMLSMRLLTAV